VFVVDTNIFVYALNRGCQEHEVARTFVNQCREAVGPWYTTWGILYEFLRVCTHPRVFRQPLSAGKAWEFVRSLLESPGVRVLAQGLDHAQVLEATIREIHGLRGNLLHDAHTAVLMREYGIRRIYTRDTDFHRFPFLEVIDPLAFSK